jgi:hypothetical protein
MRLSPLRTSATNWPIAPAPDDRWWVWSSRWNEKWQGKSKYSEKTCPSATLSTTNHTYSERGSNSGPELGSRPLTDWAMARPLVLILVVAVSEGCKNFSAVLQRCQPIIQRRLLPTMLVSLDYYYWCYSLKLSSRKFRNSRRTYSVWNLDYRVSLKGCKTQRESNEGVSAETAGRDANCYAFTLNVQRTFHCLSYDVYYKKL